MNLEIFDLRLRPQTLAKGLKKTCMTNSRKNIKKTVPVKTKAKSRRPFPYIGKTPKGASSGEMLKGGNWSWGIS